MEGENEAKPSWYSLKQHEAGACLESRRYFHKGSAARVVSDARVGAIGQFKRTGD